jgi:hypothetical protein
MKKLKSFSLKEAIDVVKSLSYDDQEILLDTIGKRLRKHRRAELLKEISESREAYERGDFHQGTVDDFMKDLDNDND